MTKIYLKYLVKYLTLLFDNKYSHDKLFQQELLLLNINEATIIVGAIIYLLII